MDGNLRPESPGSTAEFFLHTLDEMAFSGVWENTNACLWHTRFRLIGSYLAIKPVIQLNVKVRGYEK